MDTSTVPVSVLQTATDSALATHEILDEAAHQQLATDEDEDVTWLTSRLDSVSTELQNLKATNETSTSAMMTAFQESQNQSRTLLETQAQMITTLTDNLTALSQSALLRSVPENLASTLPDESLTPEATVEVIAVEPAESAAIAEASVPASPSRKRTRL